HSKDGITRMRDLIDSKVEPAYGSWIALRDHKCSQSDYQPYGPFEIISRDGEYGWTKPKMEDDFAAAWQNALMWVLTGNDAHAKKSLKILTSYANTLRLIPSTNDAPLLVGLEGLRIVYATELLKYTYPSMTKKDYNKISNMLRNHFLPVMEWFYKQPAYTNGNWGPIVTSAYMALGIMWDNHKMFDRAIDFYLNANDNGTIANYVDYITGQVQESGRDQGHSMLGIGALATVCELAWQQGVDIYSALDNRLLKGYEYVAKYNMGEDMPFRQWKDVTGKYCDWTVISEKSRGKFRPVFEMAFNHYVARMGLKMPYTENYLRVCRPEGISYDHPGFGSLLFNDWSKTDGSFDVDEAITYCHSKLKNALSRINAESHSDNVKVPVMIDNSTKYWSYGTPSDWRLGFWPGILWMDYRLTGDKDVAVAASEFTHALEYLSREKAVGHDLGFLVFCSFGNEYMSKYKSETTDAIDVKAIILNAADSLAKLYNPNVGTILSWPSNVRLFGGHNTIMDNMMNLELLFWAARNGGDSSLDVIARNHANRTAECAFRPDGSSYHVVVYEPNTGKRLCGVTHQGYSDESMWARGQSWAIYGFTMAYRFTNELTYLNTATKAADIFLERLPSDYVPYWDFDYPGIPDSPRDASAAAITASALLELENYVNYGKSSHYHDAALKILASLSSNFYRSCEENEAFLLHSTGHHPRQKEIDCSFTYADYYYLEALERLKNKELNTCNLTVR
ncbi:MAG: glycoside hydrolase family 88 protein, partial [Bacteroidaceae bacterium]|nr:glycoside hydrolase family 88 protein [Bacteroidaceae bacterium]